MIGDKSTASQQVSMNQFPIISFVLERFDLLPTLAQLRNLAKTRTASTVLKKLGQRINKKS